MRTKTAFFNLKYIFVILNRDVAQPVSVLAWGARGRWFESSHPDKSFLFFRKDFFFSESVILQSYRIIP